MFAVSNQQRLLTLPDKCGPLDRQVLQKQFLDRMCVRHRYKFAFTIEPTRKQQVFLRMPAEGGQHGLVVVACVRVFNLFEIKSVRLQELALVAEHFCV